MWPLYPCSAFSVMEQIDFSREFAIIKEKGMILCQQYPCSEGLRLQCTGQDHMPPHFHATYGGEEVIVSIKELEVLEGNIPSKQLKMLLGWAAIRQDQLMDNWELAVRKQELFAIEPLR